MKKEAPLMICNTRVYLITRITEEEQVKSNYVTYSSDRTHIRPNTIHSVSDIPIFAQRKGIFRQNQRNGVKAE